MDDAGDIAPAAAMGMMIFYTNAFVRISYVIITKKVLVKFQQWRTN
jgi:iron(III) transport system permease protein